MRPLEALLVGALVVSLALRWIRPRNRQVTSSTLAMLAILALLHLLFDGARWEMTPAYVMALAAAWVMAGDLRRVSGARAGESSRWAAIPSSGRRALNGALLATGAAAGVLIPAWAFPRIIFPPLDGFYEVGRLDLSWADTSRRSSSGTPRAVLVSAWYPAEAPNGRDLRYHPHPGVLGADLARGTPLPGFAFRNLTAARTGATGNPRFSIREGRSPVVVASHRVGGTRMEGTALYQRLASFGYVVLSVEHPGSAVGTVLGDGTHVPFSPESRAAEVALRVADLRFVLDRVQHVPGGDAGDTLAGHLRLDRVAVLGLEEGGSAAAEMAALDDRVTAAVGILPDTLMTATRGIRRPFLVFTVGDPPASLDTALRYGATEVRLEAATRQSLRDLALVGTPVLRLLGISGPDAARDVHAAVSALVLRFLDQYLKERREQTEVGLPSRVHLRVIPHQATGRD